MDTLSEDQGLQAVLDRMDVMDGIEGVDNEALEDFQQLTDYLTSNDPSIPFPEEVPAVRYQKTPMCDPLTRVKQYEPPIPHHHQQQQQQQQHHPSSQQQHHPSSQQQQPHTSSQQHPS
ncbi:unnamed protein product, partial [Owenia fusiformis]